MPVPNNKGHPGQGCPSHSLTAWATTPVRVTQILGPETVPQKQRGRAETVLSGASSVYAAEDWIFSLQALVAL
jgi:hypothetical protein